MTPRIFNLIFLISSVFLSQIALAVTPDPDVELVFAIGRSDVNGVRNLMKGRDPDQLIGFRSRTPLGEAITNCATPNITDVIRVIIDAGANLEISPQPSRTTWNSFVFATSFYQCPIAVWELLADRGANIAFVTQYGQLGESGFFKGDTLRRAIAERHSDEQYLVSLAKFCFDRGLAVDASYFSDLHEGYELTGLQLSVLGGFPELVKLHAHYGANLDLRIFNNFSGELQQSAVGFAVQFQENESLKALLQAGANPNNWTKRDGYTPLSLAASQANVDAIKLLVSHGAFIHPKYQSSMFKEAEIISDALFSASTSESLITLLELGANSSLSYASWESRCEKTTLHFSRMQNPFHDGLDSVKILKDKGSNISAYSVCDGKERDLFTAFRQVKTKESVKALIDLGLKVDRQRQSDGMTPLAIAAGFSMYPTVGALLDNGADMYIRDNKGRLAIEIVSPNSTSYQLVIDAFCSRGMVHTLCGN